MITTERIIEVGEIAGFDVAPADEYQPKPELTDSGNRWITDRIEFIANHFYKQGLLDAAEKCDAQAEYHRDVSEPQERTAMYIAKTIRQMAEEVK